MPSGSGSWWASQKISASALASASVVGGPSRIVSHTAMTMSASSTAYTTPTTA